eukprot:362721-Chlamydomonas_euryale.AAC.13
MGRVVVRARPSRSRPYVIANAPDEISDGKLFLRVIFACPCGEQYSDSNCSAQPGEMYSTDTHERGDCLHVLKMSIDISSTCAF